MSDLVNRMHVHLLAGTREGLAGIELDNGEAQAYPFALYDRAVTALVVDAKGVPLAAGVRGGGLWTSSDGGKTWRESARLAGREARAMAGNGREVLVATAPAGLERSADGGQTFSTVPLEVPARAAWSSPGSEPAPYVSSVLASDGRIVVGVNRGGVLISADGGRSFRDVTGDVAPGVLALASAGPSLLVATADGLFAGDAAGNSFSLLFRPPQREAVTAVATAPSHPLRLILGASRAVSLAKPGVPAGCDSRIYRSVNAGASFTEIGRELLPVVRGYFTSFVFAPRDPDRLFAGTSSGEIFESRDGGVSFHLIVSTLPSVLSLSLGPAFFS